MNDRNAPVTEDELHAYVDGELPPERRRAVEAWLASHPEDGARVARWRAQAEQIRARYAGIAANPPPPRLDLDRIGRADRRWNRLAAAAVAAAFVLGGLAGWFARENIDGGTAAKMVTAEAIDAYKLYVVEVRHPVEVSGAEAAHLVAWLSKRLGYEVQAPDLAPVGLQLVGGRLLPAQTGGGAGFFMYETASGERYTLYCARSDAPETALRYRVAGPVAAYYWIDDNKVYVISGPSDRDRLLQVAQSAYDQLEGRPGKGHSS